MTVLRENRLYRRSRTWFLALALATLAGAGPASAQIAGGLDKKSGTIEIEAAEGIEWLRDEKVYIARGDAHAISGDLEVFADTMKAHYRSDQGGNEIHLIELDGNVRLKTPDETAYGDHASYTLEEEILVLTGDSLRLESNNGPDRLTARDALEYHQKQRIAIARGNARIFREGRDVSADLLIAYFSPGAQGELGIERVEAEGRVQIRSKGDYATGDDAVYYVRDERATIRGNVKITRGDHQLTGGLGEVNLATGMSRLTGATSGDGKKERVKGLILPRAVSNDGDDQSPSQ
jgi:lipopolysaccharide export system protein LptA